MLKQRFIEIEVEPAIYDLLSWELPGFKSGLPKVAKKKLCAPYKPTRAI